MLTIDLQRLPVQPGDRVLDLGCGEGRHSIGVSLHYPQATVVGLDIDSKDLRTAHQRMVEWQQPGNSGAVFVRGNGFALPFADDCFDHVICSEVLEHIPDYEHFFAELCRVLRPGGQLAVSVPRAWPERICWWLSDDYHQVEGGHVHIFRRKHIRELAQNTGLMPAASEHGAHALHTPYWWLRCLFWKKGEDFFMVRAYHRFLVWDLLSAPWLTRTLDKWLNPILGKSVVFYFTRPAEPQITPDK